MPEMPPETFGKGALAPHVLEAALDKLKWNNDHPDDVAEFTPNQSRALYEHVNQLKARTNRAPNRQVSLSIAQIQSLALKTMGFRPDHEVRVRAPYEDSCEVEFDIYHVRVGIDYDGKWRAWSVDSEGDANEQLAEGPMPRFYEWREGR